MGNVCNGGGGGRGGGLRNNQQRQQRTISNSRRPPYKRTTSAPTTANNHQRRQPNNNNNNNGTLFYERSTSVRYPSSSKKHQQRQSQQEVDDSFPRSRSSRPPSSNDPLLQPHQLLHQDTKLNDLPTCHFVLVHGGGFGAWCWYKTITLLEESGYKVTAIDLAGSGIDSFDTNEITSLSQYVKPLTEFLEKLADDDKVILVGHDFGGTCISYAMELLPSKVSKAIFVAAIMLTDGQSAQEIFSKQVDSKDLLQKAQIFRYANGNNNPPTAIDLDRTLLTELLFNQSSTKDIALASVSMRPVPFAPVLEKLHLSTDNYGTVRRFYIETAEDNVIPVTLQSQMTEASPPEKVFRLKGADHSPFFSKPQALHKHLVEISKIL